MYRLVLITEITESRQIRSRRSDFETLIEANEDFDENVFNIATGTTYNILELAHNVSTVYKEKYNKEATPF